MRHLPGGINNTLNILANYHLTGRMQFEVIHGSSRRLYTFTDISEMRIGMVWRKRRAQPAICSFTGKFE